MRYRAAVSKLCRAVNVIGEAFVLPPIEASNITAHYIEVEGTPPPEGVVYFEDSERRDATKGNVRQCGKSAVVNLPECEEDPYSTIDVTIRAVLDLLECKSVEEIATIFPSEK